MSPDPFICPCCGKTVQCPTADQIGIALDLKQMEMTIIRVLVAGNGRPVQTDRLLAEMYPDGGPSATRMYSTLKESMLHLRRKLTGSGLHIESAGYGLGWRAVWHDR